MACSVFEPELLPTETEEEKRVWLERWKSNLLNSACIQSMCSTTCLPGKNPLSSSCLQCLERNKCSGTYNCLHCIGGNPANLDSFELVYNCTRNTMEPGVLAGILIGCIFGVLFLISMVSYILLKSNVYPVLWKARLDHEYYTTSEVSSVPKPIF